MPAEKLSYLDRKSIGRCVQDGCDREAAPDINRCIMHHRRALKSAAESAARRREVRLADGLCVRCPVGNVRKVWPATSDTCLACRVLRRRIRKADGTRDKELDRDAAIAAATRTHEDGRTRYHGQGKRGQQPQAQLNRQDIGMARRAIDAGEQGLELLETEEVRALPRIQRSDVKQAAAHQLDRATRHIDDVLERLGHFGKKHGRRTGDE